MHRCILNIGVNMAEKINCPYCRKLNDLNNYCVYCGKKLPEDKVNALRNIDKHSHPYCLNCGRPVERGQTECECRYEFRDIHCPNCQAKNTYETMFCGSCGKRLWSCDVAVYSYNKKNLLDEKNIRNMSNSDNEFPHGLRNTSLYKRDRLQYDIHFPGDLDKITNSIVKLQYYESKADENLNEICSRWKIISPHFCLKCNNIIKPDEFSCPKCKSEFSADKKRVSYIQNTKNNYTEPLFEMADLKWSSKFSDQYISSLTPSIAETQLEYRERLKWAFAENIALKKYIKITIKKLIMPHHVKKPQEVVYTENSNNYQNDYPQTDWEARGMTWEQYAQWQEEERERRKEEIERWNREFWENDKYR